MEKKAVFFQVLLLLVTFKAGARESVCPIWEAGTLPPCPATGAEILPDNYPVSAITIGGITPSLRYDPELVASFIGKVFKLSDKHKPYFVLPLSQETFTRVSQILEKSSNNHLEREDLRRRLVRVTNSAYPWQQDVFQNFTSPNGTTTIRMSADYAGRSDLKALAQELKTCNVVNGEKLPKLSTSINVSQNDDPARNAFEGGNLEGLPGGACLIGNPNNDERTIRADSRKFCPKAVVLPTHWLKVGHIDELVHVVKSPTHPSPCDFAIAIASPESALKALRDSSKIEPHELFFPAILPNITSTRFLPPAFPIVDICRRALILRSQKNKERPPLPSENSQPESMNRHTPGISFSVSSANAQEQTLENKNEAYRFCKDITNAEAVEVINNDRIFLINQHSIQAKMNEAKNVIKNQIAQDLPQCKFAFIDIPVLFSRNDNVKPKHGSIALPKNYFVSMFPNPINGFSVGSGIITADPLNSALRKETTRSFQAAGVKTEYVNTFLYRGHHQGGDLHCISNAFRACQPR